MLVMATDKVIYMSFVKFLSIVFALVLVGCTHQPTPYHVVDSLPYKKGHMSGFYKRGVTEEVIKKDNYYKVTVKIDRDSSKKRATQMLLLHSAKLAQASGSEAFTIKKIKTNVWCGFAGNKRGPTRVKNSGPMSSAFITIVQPDTPEEMLKRKRYLVVDILAQHEKNITEAVLEIPADVSRKANQDACFARLHNQA